MDLNLLHLCMELSAAACLFYIAWMNIQYNATGIYSNLMAIGATAAGIADTLHALVPIFLPTLLGYCTLGWGISRITLIMTFMLVIFCYNTIRCKFNTVVTILLMPLLLYISVIISQLFGMHTMSYVYIHLANSYDFVLLVLWVAVAIMLREKSHILFPPHAYWLFMSQGILVHAIMAFASTQYLDIPSFMAHAIKISEYYSFILIYLLYNSSHNEILIYKQRMINIKDTSTAPAAVLELTRRK